MKFSTWLTAALVSVSVTLAPDASAKVHEDFEKVVPFSAGGQFSIKNDNGSITIKTWNEGISASRRKRPPRTRNL